MTMRDRGTRVLDGGVPFLGRECPGDGFYVLFKSSPRKIRRSVGVAARRGLSCFGAPGELLGGRVGSPCSCVLRFNRGDFLGVFRGGFNGVSGGSCV